MSCYFGGHLALKVLLTVNVIKRSVCVEGIADGVRRLEITMGRATGLLFRNLTLSYHNKGICTYV